jgi:trans-aconitate methyltransferase
MASTDRRYFDEQYATDPDPWGFESRWYERRKYELTMAALPSPRYRSAFEPGCSVGVLSAMLAQRCDRLLATDIVPAVVERAAARLQDAPHVEVELRAIPESWPEGRFDLVVLSEIGYYFDLPTFANVLDRAVASTGPGAAIVAAHWRGTTDYPLTGDEVHALIGAHPALEVRVDHVEEEFLLGVWIRH